MPIIDKPLLYEIAITLVPGVGDVLTKNLISYCGSAHEVFSAKKSHLLRVPGIGEKIADEIVRFRDFKRAEKELLFIEKHNVKTHFYPDKHYPVRLKQLDDAPAMLYSVGEADLNNSRIVGIVGTRKASEYGRSCVESLTHELAATGCLILSGLAYGIDIHAHREALKNKLPTVGVMAHGLDRVYPAQHSSTAKKMLEQGGGLLTEFMSQSNPDRENFPKRNRIVAGLCDVLVVVETAERGGAMITAEIANGYNKDVAAFPGRVNDEYSKGCNNLIRNHKAHLITGIEDLYYLMGWNTESPKPKLQRSLPFDLSDAEKMIYQCIQDKSRIGIDEMAFSLQISSGNLSLQLLEMEMKGLLRSLPGKCYELI